MSTTVSAGSLTVTSTSESAADMSAALRPQEDKPAEPRVLVDKGVPVEEEPKDAVSEAASRLGKKGGEAAAKARKAAEKADKGKETPEPAEGDTEPEEEEPETPPAEDKEPQGKPRKDPNARVWQATKEAREAREAEAEARAEARELRYRLEAAERARTAPAERTARDGQERPEAPQRGAQPSERPKEDDFESYSDFVDALTDWKVEQRVQKSRQEWQAHQVATRHAQEIDGMVKGWNDTLAKAAEADPEFLDRVDPVLKEIGLPSRLLPEGTRPDGRNWIADDLVSAPEQARPLLLYFHEHPDERQRVAALSSPRAITRELATIFVRLDAATAGTSSTREVSKAHPPVRPVTGTPHTAGQELDDSAPLSAFVHSFGQRELKARSR